MRIISGRAGGRPLKSPPGRKVRPTTDRVREALFSILGDVTGAVVVDGFAGSGALGLEAISRGAKKGYFFDTSRSAVDTIRENVRRLKMDDHSVVRQCDFVQGLERVVDEEPDLWFLDPPYQTSLAQQALEAMSTCEEKVTEGALVVWESEKDEPLLEAPRFEVWREKIYGRTRLVFFRCIA